MIEIRDYRDADATSWLRCRLLSFFNTEYFDDVVVERPTLENPVHRLVAVENDTVVGLMDVELFPDRATIAVLAIHPDHQREGLATRLLDAVLPRLESDVLDAWTRGDAAANDWYQRISAEAVMRERFGRVHVCRQYVRRL
ncbi:ribosomal protein S18 acetylase RimI-like enzyme [Kribbella aluminosa]|uniref:Ribosomal protein S18 acetylase RimI-like enzyme n=1 Tax=Kribbella aluminosa TaxID=416017 RepID=A0ABS4UQA2_9ACTN|nr:GNAT family N-acetyltransferase [Kribbella aluminosa]MBP2353756.1 ribosomal protein S18 acetylase RimI-like enzyme [Kribbella aluminosa]